MEWRYKSFDSLSPYELYSVLQLRNEVFVVEQACIFQDADDKDQQAYHLMGFSGEKLVAYTRLLPAGLSYAEASIGRVVTSPTVRGTGTGRTLMERSIETLYILWGKQPIRIGAQLYLQSFYESLGFIPCGEIYLEDDIDHRQMLLNPVKD